MCGIVVMMSNDKLKGMKDRVKAFTQGVIVDTLRGPHSTGLVYADYKGNAEIYKKPIPGYDFVNMNKYNSVLNDADEYPFIIAHNRWATQGKVNTENAHPFQHKHITGVHNGSLYSWKDLAPDQDFDTDSEYIFHALAHNDSADVIKEIDGAFVIVWHDARDNTMHIARNDERPFHLAHIKGTETILGVSELEMLDLMCARNKLEVDERYQVNTDIELVFSLDKLHDPEVLEREMLDPWTGYGGGYNMGKRLGGTPTSTGYTSTVFDDRTAYCMMTDFKQYSTSGYYGYIEAVDLATDDVVRINGLTEQEFGLLDKKDGYFECTISASGRDSDGLTYVIGNRNTVRWIAEGTALDGASAIVIANEVDADEDDTVQEVETITTKKFYTKVGQNICYTTGEAEAILKNGCCLCGDPVPLDTFETIEWWNAEPVCESCSDVGAPLSILEA